MFVDLVNRPVFYLCFRNVQQRVSAPSPEFGASSSRDLAPVTPNASESDDGDDSARKKARKYKRPRVKWDIVVSIGADAEMDDDERKAQILQGVQAFMEAGKIYMLPGHES